MGSFFSYKSSPNCLSFFFPRQTFFIDYDEKWFLATFWAISSQTGHPALCMVVSNFQRTNDLGRLSPESGKSKTKEPTQTKLF
jgi:hypothetical protein